MARTQYSIIDTDVHHNFAGPTTLDPYLPRALPPRGGEHAALVSVRQRRPASRRRLPHRRGPAQRAAFPARIPPSWREDLLDRYDIDYASSAAAA